MARPKKTITAPPAESLPDIPILWQVPLSEPTHPLGDRAARDRHEASAVLGANTKPARGFQAKRVERVLRQLRAAGVRLENYTQAGLQRLIEEQISRDAEAKKAKLPDPSPKTMNRVIKRLLNK
jgi:hypothetical protein